LDFSSEQQSYFPPKTGQSRLIESALGGQRSLETKATPAAPAAEARPLTDMWYPGLSDFKGMTASDFCERYEAKLQERKGINKKRADTQMLGVKRPIYI
jgi:hypothetical protein